MTPADLIAWRTLLRRDKSGAAKLLGCSRNAYAGYEAGKHPIPRYIALACAAVAQGVPPMGERDTNPAE